MVDAPKDHAVKEPEVMDIELADEQQILEELQGKTLTAEDRWVYPIQGGFQLTYKAVKLACRMFAEHGEAIDVSFPADVKYDPQNPEYLLVQVKGTRIQIEAKTGSRIILDSAIGSKRKWVKEKLKDGTVRADQNYYEKAVAQAERNAKMALLPQDFVKNFVAQILRGQKQGPPAQKAQVGTPQDVERAARAKDAKPPQEEKKAAAPAQAQKSNGKASEISALHQQFWAILKSITKQKDEGAGRQALKRLTGKEKVSELTEAELKTLGGLLRKVSKAECEIKPHESDKNKSIIVDSPTKEVVWPEGYKAPAREEAPPPQEEASSAPQGDAPPGGGEWLI